MTEVIHLRFDLKKRKLNSDRRYVVLLEYLDYNSEEILALKSK